MTARKACNARFFLDGYDMSGQSSGASIAFDTGVLEYDQMQNCGVLKIPTASETVFDHNGYYNDKTAGYLEREVYTRLGAASDNFIGYIPDDTLVPAPAYVVDNCFASQLNVDAPVKELLTVKGQWPTGDLPTARGYIVYDGTISGVGTKTAVDFGAAGSAGGRAYLFVWAISGTAVSADIVVESATTSGGSYSAEGTFTFGTATPSAFAVDLSGVVDQFIRINTTDMGGATSFGVTVIVALNGVTQ